MGFGIEVKDATGAVTFNSDSVGAFVLASMQVAETDSGTWKADFVGANVDGYGLEIFPIQWQSPNINYLPNFITHSLTVTYVTSAGVSYTSAAADRYPKLVYAPENSVESYFGNPTHDSVIYIFARAV